jgi:hypothetical protein
MPPRKRKAGRPSLGVSARNRSVLVRLTEVEYSAIAAAVAQANAKPAHDKATAEARRTTISSWLRDHALNPLGMMPASSED